MNYFKYQKKLLSNYFQFCLTKAIMVVKIYIDYVVWEILTKEMER